jgi:hypothetical protein
MQDAETGATLHPARREVRGEERGMTAYPIYGGPLHGGTAEEGASVYGSRAALASFASRDVEGKVSDWPKYHYVLCKSDDGTKAFLPREDRNLLIAYQQTSRLTEDPAAEALLSEIHRRDLDI